MRSVRVPIRIKLLLLLSGMAALATGLALALQDRALAADLERAAVARLERAADAAERLVAGHVQTMRERYRAISGTPQFRANLEVGDAATLTFYAEQLAAREGASLIAFLDPSGRAIALAGEAPLLTHDTGGLVAREGRTFASVRIPLETAGVALGSLVAAEPVGGETISSWSALCGAQVVFLRPGTVVDGVLERTVLRLGDGGDLRVLASLEAERGALVHSRANLLAAGLVALGLAFAASFWISRGLVRPILSIQTATERIALGDFDVRTPSDRRDEIGDVARAFDGMLDRLRRYLSELRRSRERLESAQRLARVGSWQLDLQSGELTGSREFRAILGLPEDEPEKTIPHALVFERIHRDERAEFEEALRLSLSEGVGFYMDHRILREDGERIVHTQAQIASDDGARRRLEGTVQDVTDHRRTEEQIRYLAYRDSLTGLGNRRLFAERLEIAIAAARRNDSSLGILLLDLDHFKRINDTLGHSVGDALLRRVADRLVAVVRSSDVVTHAARASDPAVSRLGGDEFTLLVTDVVDPSNLAKVAQRTLNALARPFDLQGREVVVGGSIGITTWPMDGEGVETLLRNADTAMYHAKDQGRNNYQFYTAAMNAAALHRLTVEQNLRRALDESEFEVHYQPKVELGSGCISGFEALIRWRDPEAGLVLPGEFIPVAEETGLIVAIGEWVLRTSCEQIAHWRASGQPVLPVAVNLSAHQFQGGHLVEVVSRILRETGVEPELLEIEITESTLMSNQESVVAVLQALRGRGIRIAIDDFGTGHSSLAYLRRLPVDTLKIDRSFVQHIEANHGDASLAAAIISMGRALHLKLVAEGVETPAQRELLETWGCDEFQGFVFSPALPADEVTALWDAAGERAPWR